MDAEPVFFLSLIHISKQHWADAGNDLKDMKSIAIYVNANEMMVYYVVNDTEKGQFSLA